MVPNRITEIHAVAHTIVQPMVIFPRVSKLSLASMINVDWARSVVAKPEI